MEQWAYVLVRIRAVRKECSICGSARFAIESLILPGLGTGNHWLERRIEV